MRTAVVLFLLALPAGAGEIMGPPAPRGRETTPENVRVSPWGWQEGAIIGASLADLASTELALHGVPGAREGNPLMVSTGVRVPLKLAYTGAVVWLYRALEKRGQHRWARTVLIFAVAVWGGAAAWNLSLV